MSVDDADSQRLRDHTSSWEAVAASDPLWGVCSTAAGRDGGWDLEDFWRSGRVDVASLRRICEAAGGSFTGRTLDFGCGVGRLSRALADHVDHVVGVDIAEQMIERANELNSRRSVEFVLQRSYDLPFADRSFDLVVSLYVLQHMEPTMALRFLTELVRVLRPGGTLVVQNTTEPWTVTPIPKEHRRASFEVVSAPASLEAGEVGFVRVRVTNASGAAWPSRRLIKLANHWRREGEVVVADDGRRDLPATLPPGASVELDLRVAAPDEPGTYEIEIDMVQEFVAWWADSGNACAHHTVDVTPRAAMRLDDARPLGDSIVTMHGVPESDVLATLESAGCDVLAASPDDFEYAGWVSRTYVARRRGSPRQMLMPRLRRIFSGGSRRARPARRAAAGG